MDRQYIDDYHIVPRYLADQLTDAEREAFEAYYLEHPEVLREIEATARFKAGLAQLQASGELAALMKPTPWYAQGRYLAMAAIVILVIAAAFYVRTPAPPLIATSLSELSGPTAVASSNIVLRRRGSSFDAEVTLPGTSDAIELRVLPEFAAPDSRYRIDLARIDADNKKQHVAQIAHLLAAGDGMVTIYLDSPRIAPGDYEITIANDTGASQASQFLIRISR
ncbi:hypothetical protein ACFPN2_11845 [Steroidobacter flavus]|uniref:Anti-sigma factor n=1 Tax=Steroidobacter flavus TaxID=1842136 RepID=A0ABV8SQV5_9GAMM